MGGGYDIFKYTPITTGQPITQFFNIRRTSRSCGHISVSDHFTKWTELGMTLGKLTEVDILVESGGGVGGVDFTRVRVSVNN